MDNEDSDQTARCAGKSELLGPHFGSFSHVAAQCYIPRQESAFYPISMSAFAIFDKKLTGTEVDSVIFVRILFYANDNKQFRKCIWQTIKSSYYILSNHLWFS